jgi:hypothetical protein
MVYETREQLEKRKLSARYKLRSIIRKVGVNKSWLSNVDAQIGDNVRKNVAILLRKKPKKEMLTIYDRKILKTPPHRRTEMDVLKLEILFEKLPCFATFSPVSYATSRRAENFKLQSFFRQFASNWRSQSNSSASQKAECSSSRVTQSSRCASSSLVRW